MQFIALGLIGVLIITVLRVTRRRRHRDIFGRRNGIEQTVTAFLTAPLVASAVAFVVSFAVYRESMTAFIFASVTASFGYLGAVVLGIPVYGFLLWRNMTSPWISAASGALIAMATGLAIWGDQVAHDFTALLLITGMLGTIAGLSFWAIARPDRQYGAWTPLDTA